MRYFAKIFLMFLLFSVAVPAVSAGVIFSDDFNDNDISDWTINVNGDAGAIADNGRMRLRVWKCSDTTVYKDLGFISGEITIDFDWQTQSEGWPEPVGWKLVVDGVTVFLDGLTVPKYGGLSGHVTKNIDVGGNVQLVYWISRSPWCGNSDHYNTYLWVDNVVVNLSDEIPPETAIILNGDSGLNGWYISDVQATLAATDNEGGSGVKNTEYSFDGTNWNLYTVPFTITNEGANTVYYRSTDNAGNVEPIKNQTIKIDKMPPVITGIPTIIIKFSDDFNDNDISDWTQSVNGDAGAIADNGRMRLRVWKCSDTTVYKDLGFISGEITIDFDWQTQSEGWPEPVGWKLVVDGATVFLDGLTVPKYGGLSGHVTKNIDVGGNVQLVYWISRSPWCGNSDHYNTYLWVDDVVVKTAANSWYNKDVVVYFTASDDISGIDAITPDTIISTEGTSQSVTGTAIDKAGNSASTTVSGINIDKTPPEVTINIPASGGVYLLNQALTADWSATDSLSGIASATGTLPDGAAIDTSMAGTKTFTVVATDIASNTATQTSSYTIAYNFLGILPPIKTDGSSIFKSGSTVPVKFRIADANGNYVSTAVASITYQLVADGVPGNIEVPVSTSAASEGNTFRYDGTENLYIFNLGTEGMNTGTYQLNINLDDGTVHTVHISLR